MSSTTTRSRQDADAGTRLAQRPWNATGDTKSDPPRFLIAAAAVAISGYTPGLSRRAARRVGGRRASPRSKDDGRNRVASFKDRASSVA